MAAVPTVPWPWPERPGWPAAFTSSSSFSFRETRIRPRLCTAVASCLIPAFARRRTRMLVASTDLSIEAELERACKKGSEKAILRLLRSHPGQMRLLMGQPFGTNRITPFAYLCWFVHCEAIEEVCSSFTEEVRPSIDHALSVASRFGKKEVLDILMHHFPNECCNSLPRDFAEACRKSRVQAALCWLNTFPDEAGATLSDSISLDQTTPLYWACRNGLDSVVRALIQRHPTRVRAALNIGDADGRTGLSFACQNGHEEVVKLLLGLLPDLQDPAPEPKQGMLSAEQRSDNPVMVSEDGRGLLQQQGYKLVGSHSAVKQCRWTKSALFGEGQCYKHTFYGISSHRCMEGTPSLACANKCTFCWRGHANPVTTSWTYQTDAPEAIVAESVQRHLEMLENVAFSPRALPSRVAEARRVGHMALSLVGEPVLYPAASELVGELHRRRISSFLVTNGQFPEELERLAWVTQLYVSLDAANEDDLKEVSRPLFKDHWQRLRRSLEVLREKRPYQRTVARLTVLKGKNMERSACDGYAELVQLGDCDFVEVKGATFAGWDDRSGLSMSSVPWHEEVRDFAEQLSESLPGYEIACEHEHSCSVLLARRDRFFIDNKWRTWIDFERFADAAQEGRMLEVSDFTLETPAWALASGWQEAGAQSPGFDPAEHRRKPRLSKAEYLAS